VSSELQWDVIFAKRRDLAPPGYEQAVEQARLDSSQRYESKVIGNRQKRQKQRRTVSRHEARKPGLTFTKYDHTQNRLKSH